MGINLRPFSEFEEEEILQFSQNHLWKPVWTHQHVKEFLHDLISSKELIFDLHLDKKRIAVAILIDKIQNKGGNACLEFVGLDKESNILLAYKTVLHAAKKCLPKNRSGIEAIVHESLKEIADLLLEEGFKPYYETFEMIGNTKNDPSAYTEYFYPLIEKDYLCCYEMIVESFKDNPDKCMPDYEDWKKIQSEGTTTWIYKENHEIVGFLNIVIDPENTLGEIRALSVSPAYRGKGIGKKLLSFALDHLAQNKIENAQLTVAVQNRHALDLYLELGFVIKDAYQIFCWKAN